MKSVKNLLVSTLILVSTLSGITFVHAEDLPPTREVIVPVNNVYAPGGFDSTSDSYVVVNGIFPNGCYRWSRASLESRSEFDHDITTMAQVTQGMCIQVLIPYQKEVRLGRLSAGKHKLKFLNGDGTFIEKQLVVE